MPYSQGDCFVVQAPTSPKDHLYIIITEPREDGSFVIVNVTSCEYEDIDDLTCILNSSDHGFISHDSFVFYAKATIAYEAEWSKAIKLQGGNQTTSMGKNVVKDILCGIFESDLTPDDIKKYISQVFSYDEECDDP
jgi:hypothetical protein